MADDKKLNELPLLSGDLADADEFYVVRNGTDYRATGDKIPGGDGAVASVDGQTGVVVTGYDERISALEGVVPPSPSGNALLSGGGVAFSTGLSVVVSAATYQIQGTAYSSAETTLTSATADPTNPRIDVVAVNSSGVAVIIEGTPAATPVKPDVDPTTQLELTFYIVGAGATALTVNKVIVYDENNDYTMSESGTSIDLESTNNPHDGTKCIEGTSVPANDYFQAQTASGTIDLGDFDNLVFFIRNKTGAWAANKQITITARSSGTQVGSSVTFKNGLFGFSTANITTYQQIVIPASLFAANGQAINQLRWTIQGSGAAIPGFYVDDISLEGGLAPLVDATRLKDRGEHDSALLYQVNDVVTDAGVAWSCLASHTNKTPASNVGTYWRRLAGTSTLYNWDAVQGQQPSANAAAFDTRNLQPVYDFDKTTNESLVFRGMIPEGADLSGGVQVRIYTTSPQTSGNIIFTAAFERCNTDCDSDSFATGVDSAATATNATSGIPTVITVSLTSSEIDGLAAGEMFRLKITRNATSVSDTVDDDIELHAVELRSL
jgi:hypothetical protein